MEMEKVCAAFYSTVVGRANEKHLEASAFTKDTEEAQGMRIATDSAGLGAAPRAE